MCLVLFYVTTNSTDYVFLLVMPINYGRLQREV